MARKQHRRSISISRVLYDQVKAFAEANNISMSQLSERGLRFVCGFPAPADASKAEDAHA